MQHVNYNLNPREVPHYFDLQEGQLVIGERAYHRSLNNGTAPEHIRTLGTLLLDASHTIEPHFYDKMDVSGWREARYRKFGRWLDLAVTSADDHYSNVTQSLIDRSYRLGLGPSSARIAKPYNFGSLIRFYDEADINYSFAHGRYDNWPRDRFTDHVEHTYLTLEPGQALVATLTHKARSKEGPGVKIIRTHAGNILALLAERGYPDIPRWTDNDFIDWGVAYMLANGGVVPTKSRLDYLASVRRGPTGRTIFNHFVSLVDYQEQVTAKHAETQKTIEQIIKERVAHMKARRQGNFLLIPTMGARYVPGWLALRMSAQYLLLDSLGAILPDDKKEVVATFARQRDFLARIQALVSPTPVSNLCDRAQWLGIQDDIWPKHNPEYLHNPTLQRAA